MSLINRIQVVNYLNSNRITPEWHPAYRVVTLDLHGLSTAIHATNGVGKTTLTNGLFWLMTRKKVFLDKIKSYGLAPNSSSLSHLRIEFLRPLPVIGDPQMQFSMQGLPSAPKGEPWVVGFASHRDDANPCFYYYQGRLEESEVGRFVDGSPEVVSDEEALENFKMVVRNKSGKIVSTASEWREFIHGNHISKRMFATFEQFQLRGGGDKSSDLFPVTVRAGENYDTALFYTHIAPQLMAGIYVDNESDNVDETEDQFEDTIITSCQQLCDTKSQLQRSEEKYGKALTTLAGMEKLSVVADDLDKATAELHNASKKVAEMGLVVDAISESGIPGLPQWVESGDPEVDALLRHMVVSPGEGPCLRSSGLDGLMGWPDGRAVEKVSRGGFPSDKISQHIEIRIQKCCAKSVMGTRTVRVFSEENAIEFINRLSAGVLNIQSDEEKGRERFRGIIQKAFAHFREQMDTSVHRAQIRAFEDQLSQARVAIKRISTDINAHEKTISDAKAKIAAIAPLKNEWLKVQDCPDFSADDKASPKKIGDRIEATSERLKQEIGSLNQKIGGISQGRQKLVDFRNVHGEKSPLEVMANIDRDIHALAQSIEEAEGLIQKVKKEIAEHQEAKEVAIKKESEAASDVTRFKTKVIALEEIERQFPEVAVGEVADSLSARKISIENEIASVEGELRSIETRKADAKKDATDVHGHAKGELDDHLECLDNATEKCNVEKGRFEQSAELEIARTKGEYNKKVAEENETKGTLAQNRQALESAYNRSIAELETNNGSVGQLRGQAIGLHDDIDRLAEAMAALQPDISLLDDFDKRYGGEHTPSQILRTKREVLQGLSLKLENFNSRVSAWEENRDLLEREQPVPQKMMRKALGIVPAELQYRRLLDLIEEAGLSSEARAIAIKTLSSVLFAPVVADDDSAAKISAVLDHAGYPIPVFLEAGIQSALASGAMNALPRCVYGHVTNSAELLLFPERRLNALARLAKNIGAAQRGRDALQSLIDGLGDNSEEMRFLDKADTAQRRKPREQHRELSSQQEIKRRDLDAIISRLGEIAIAAGFEYGAVTTSRDGVKAFADAFEAWVAQARETLTSRSAEDISAVEHDISECSKRVEALRAKLSDELSKISELLKANVARVDAKLAVILSERQETEAVDGVIRCRLDAKLSQIESEYESKVFATTNRRKLLVQNLATHNAQYGEKSQFVKTLRVAEECAQRGGREEMDRLTGLNNLRIEELESLNAQLSAKTTQLEQVEGQKVENVIALARTEDGRKQFDFEALHQFIQGGEDAALKDLYARLKAANQAQEKNAEMSKVADFKLAQDYVSQQEAERFSQEAVRNSETSVENLKKQRDYESEVAIKLKERIDEVIKMSYRYDAALCDIQECLITFEQLDVDFSKFKDEADSSLADDVRQKNCLLSTAAQLGDFGAEIIADVQTVLKGFNADEKSRKVKEAKSRIKRLQDRYSEDVESFLSREQKNLVSGMSEMIRETLAAPHQIRGLCNRFKDVVEKEMSKNSELQSKHDKLWDEQVERLTMLSSQARENYQQLCAVMKTYSSSATFDVSVKIAASEEISSAIERIRDMVGEEVERFNRLVEAGDVAKSRSSKGLISKNSHLQKNAREIMYRAVFKDPKITFWHSAISGGGKDLASAVMRQRGADRRGSASFACPHRGVLQKKR